MRYKILCKLKENPACYVSGELLSEMFGITRAAVWKHINELKKEGYVISSSSKKGYRLDFSPDLLNEFEMKYGLDTKIIGNNVLYFDSIDSTNNFAKKIALEGCKEGTVVVADTQWAGRGRLGRMWDSCSKKGIWMSVILRPTITPEEVQIITLAASVAVVKAIKESTGIEAGIKWPNDIILEGKKVCGILTEMISETDQINHVIVGIGINVNQNESDFPEELKDKAISLSIYARNNQIEKEFISGKFMFNRAAIIRSILKNMEIIYNKINNNLKSEILAEWRMHSVTLGKEVVVGIRDVQCTGTAVDITEDGRLLVKCSDGVIREVLSGEVSIRGVMGYV